MGILKRLFFLFTPYVNSSEKQVGQFFKRISENDSLAKIDRQLIGLIQKEGATINLWTERRYKGYRYLSKKMRRELYENLEIIKSDFLEFAEKTEINAVNSLSRIRNLGVSTDKVEANQEKFIFLLKIMLYLSPASGRFEYRESSSFGRLLRNPKTEKLIGDCNQIVTLYVTLYSLKFDIRDFELVMPPNHVALRFFGVDVETTNGTFKVYRDQNQVIAPIHELVSVNLLDTTDSNYTTNQVDSEAFLEAARLAYVTSSNRELVKYNLDASYNNVVRKLMKEGKYDSAYSYAKQSKNFELIEAAAYNGAINALKYKNFKKARKFAARSQKKTELEKAINQNEAAALFNNRQYDAARKIYQRLNDQSMVRRCYIGLYSLEQKKLGQIKTATDIKANAGTIRNMERHARASGDERLISNIQKLVKYL